jgi:hypothetical protein
VWREIVIAVLIFAAGCAWGLRYARASAAAGRPFGFFHELLEPAVMTACGRGFHVASQQTPPMTAFLTRAADRFDCASLPPDLKLSSARVLQGSWLYLLMMVATAWKIGGVSWDALIPLLGVLCGATLVAAYAVFRVAMGWLAAATCVALLAVSPLHLLNLTGLRDYARAPFMLAVIALVMTLALRPLSQRLVIGISLLCGGLIGIGYGVRPDVVVEFPLLVAAVVGFLPGGPTRNLRTKAVAVAGASALCALLMWPVMRATAQGGSNFWHVTLIGLMPEYGDALGVENDRYHWGVTGSDEFVQLAVGSYAARVHKDWPPLPLGSAEYAIAGERYFFEFARRFPMDMATRALASAARMPEVPFGWPVGPLPGWFDRAYAMRQSVVEPLYGYGIVATGLALVTVIAVAPRAAAFLAFTWAYVGGYPAIQFHNRHFFYLEVIGWLSIGFLASALFRVVRARGRVAEFAPTRVMMARLAAAGVMVVVGVAVLAGARAYQGRSTRRMLTRYLTAAREPLAIERSNAGSGPRLVFPAMSGASQRPDWTRYLRLDLDVAACRGGAITFAQDARSMFRGLTKVIRIPPPAGRLDTPLTIMQPLYSGFAELLLSDTGPGCVASAASVTGLDDEPLWLPLVLDADWREAPLYQSIHTRANIH